MTDGSAPKPSTGWLGSGAIGDPGGFALDANSFVLAQHCGVNEQRTSAIILISTVVAVVIFSILFSIPTMDLQ